MIIGIGTDIVEKQRVEKACLRDAFLFRTFTPLERLEIARKKSFAANNWCVKEAVAKAFGTGFVGFSPIDIEVLRNELGAPYVRLDGGAILIAKKLGVKNIFVSISDTKEYSIAYVVLEGGRDEVFTE